MKVAFHFILSRINWMARGGFCLLSVLCTSSGAFAQLPDTASLAEQKIFLSLDEAMIDPSIVFRLDLSRQHLEDIPAGVFLLTSLQELNLSHNKIQSIPEAFWNLKDIRILDLSSNKLKTLPAEIGVLTKLETLYLKRNKISSLPLEMSLLVSLKELDLWGNSIIRLPAQMATLRKTLKKIDMRGINIKTPERNAITNLLPETDIYFTGCNCN